MTAFCQGMNLTNLGEGKESLRSLFKALPEKMNMKNCGRQQAMKKAAKIENPLATLRGGILIGGKIGGQTGTTSSAMCQGSVRQICR
ncbi:hypothetical protein [Pseudobacteriovorax antillogorgiicola]|uniref:hypothetical protein n=1 Tax=Pseudobacteriovorax antillogorgiicola TaxID=1513793 RepID=UPI001A9D48B9|nr:hypothetical protein [Pseudobacteriovorax antillogorgiicola]